MPNHCINIVKFYDLEEAQVAAMIDAIENEKGLCSTFCPMPEDLVDIVSGSYRDDDGNLVDGYRVVNGIRKPVTEHEKNLLVKEHGAFNWYDWCNLHWGTKWGDYDHDLIAEGKDFVVVKFESAWSPPIGFYEKMVANGYKVCASYVEVGCDYYGSWINGRDKCMSLSDYVDIEESDYEHEEDFWDDRYAAMADLFESYTESELNVRYSHYYGLGG